MKKVSVKVVGIVSANLIIKFKSALSIPDGVKSNEIILFCDYSEFDIPIGYLFRKINVSNSYLDCNIFLKQVTQEFGVPYDSIPKGHKTICKFDLINHVIPDFQNILPVINDWYESEHYIFLT